MTSEATGEPAPGIGVQVTRDGAVIATTAADGRYRAGLEQGPGPYTVQAAALGFAAVSRQVVVGAGESPVLTLTLTGEVNVDAVPVSG